MAAEPIPYYAQSAEFSCGAACLVMALSHLDDRPVTRSTEFAYWREATMIGVRGIDQWGLAIPALERGVPATVVSEAEQTFPQRDPEVVAAYRREQAERYPDEELPTFSAEDLELAAFAQQENREDAFEAGVGWQQHAPREQDIRSALEQGAVPILLVDLERLGGGWPAPHWVVVAGVEEDTFRLLDPDPDGPGEHALDWSEVREVMDVSTYDADRAIVVLGAWTPPADA